MPGVSRRAFQRKDYVAPIQFAAINSKDYHQGKMINYSKGGMCFKTDQLPLPDNDVVIVMRDYQPGVFGPEARHTYLARVKWSRLIEHGSEFCFGAGAQFITDSQPPPEFAACLDTKPACDLCGRPVRASEIIWREDFVSLCAGCHKHLDAVNAGVIRESIDRFLEGNVF